MQPEIHSLAPVSVPLPRGVHSYVEQPSGEVVYFATTSTGEILNGEMRRRRSEETHAMVLDDMQKDLDRQDPIIGPPQLSVVSGGLASRRWRLGRSRPV